MAIKSIQLTGFRCFGDQTLNLGPVTILVGPNGSGKTSILHALDPTKYVTERDLRPPIAEPRQVYARIEDNEGIQFLRTANASAAMQSNYSLLHLAPDLKEMRNTLAVIAARRLSANGDNLVNVFASLPRKTANQVVAELCRLVPIVADVSANPSTQGSHRLVFQDRWQEDRWYEPEEVSDGTLLTFAFLVATHMPQPVDVLAIEELERGLHPYLVGEMVERLRKLANEPRADGHRTQIIIATHSPVLLDFARPEEVRFLSREDDKVVIKEAPTGPDWERAFGEYRQSLGGMWLSGGLGGVPGT